MTADTLMTQGSPPIRRGLAAPERVLVRGPRLSGRTVYRPRRRLRREVRWFGALLLVVTGMAVVGLGRPMTSGGAMTSPARERDASPGESMEPLPPSVEIGIAPLGPETAGVRGVRPAGYLLPGVDSSEMADVDRGD